MVLAYKPKLLKDNMPLVSISITYHPFNCARLATIKTNKPINAIFFCKLSLFKPQEQNINITPNKAETIIAFIANSFNLFYKQF